MLEVHFTMIGPEDSPYSNGLYHGRVLIPAEYPFAPPDVVLLTPNGRFETSKKVCLSVSSYHPEHWKATWGIGTILHSLRNFMLTPGTNGIASINYPEFKRKELADASRTFVCKDCGAHVADQWEEIMKDASPATDADKGELLPPMPPTPATDPAATPLSGAALATPSQTPNSERLPTSPPPPMTLPPVGSNNSDALSPPPRPEGEQAEASTQFGPVAALNFSPSSAAQRQDGNDNDGEMQAQGREGTSFCALTPTPSSVIGAGDFTNQRTTTNGSFSVQHTNDLNNGSLVGGVREADPLGTPPTANAAGSGAPITPMKLAGEALPQPEPQVAQLEEARPLAVPEPAPAVAPRVANNNNNNARRNPLHFEISIATIDRGLFISIAVFILMIIKKIVYDEWFNLMPALNKWYAKYML
eukprot:GILI01010079.1.p1 GENE.GILI01010079.1~~GILI01010079.1.p1  ORF type:complete len:482 (+),score=67.27 GILI01010079.1:200-1447(+)